MPFDPAWIVSLIYLSVRVGTVVTLAWTPMRWKVQPERFRGWHLCVLGPLLVTLGTVVLAAGLVKGDPVAAMLSWVDPAATRADAAAWHFGVLVIALLMRAALGRQP